MSTNQQKPKIKSYIKNQLIFDILNTILLVAIIIFLIALVGSIVGAFRGTELINPIAFYVLGWPIYWYGLILVLAFIASFLLMVYLAEGKKYHADILINFVFGATISGLIGARLVHIILNISNYLASPLSSINIWEGGLSIHGALIGGIVFVIIYAHITKIKVMPLLDLFAPAMLLGQAIGRWGNFVNQELFGYPTNSFLKMYVSPFNRPLEYRSSAFFHPVFLYESVLILVALALLLVIRKNKKLKSGTIFWWYILLYSAIRFIIEFVRIEPAFLLGLTLAQVVSVLLIAIAIVFIRQPRWLRKLLKSKKKES